MEKGKWKRESGKGELGGGWFEWGLAASGVGGRQTRLWNLRVTRAGDSKRGNRGCGQKVFGQKEGPGRVRSKPAPSES